MTSLGDFSFNLYLCVCSASCAPGKCTGSTKDSLEYQMELEDNRNKQKYCVTTKIQGKSIRYCCYGLVVPPQP